jgi:hypothetical protein
MLETKKDSFDRLSEAKERRSYHWLNEPGLTPLSFAFGSLEDNRDGWKGPRTGARSLKHRAFLRIEPRQPESKASSVLPEH